MTDRGPIDRMADAARDMIEESETLAKEAAARIDDGTYTAEAVVGVMTGFAGIAARGWLDVLTYTAEQMTAPSRSTPPRSPSAPAAPEPTPEPDRIVGTGLGANVRQWTEFTNQLFNRNLGEVERLVDRQTTAATSILAEHMTTVMRRMADQARTAVDEAAERFDEGHYGPDDYIRTATKLSDIAMINGIDLIGSAAVGPGRFETKPIISDVFTAPYADPGRSHRLSIVESFHLDGGASVVPDDHVIFVPEGGLLTAGVDVFKVAIRAAGLRSGIYEGRVWVRPVDEAGSPMSAEAHDEEIVTVIIGL